MNYLIALWAVGILALIVIAIAAVALAIAAFQVADQLPEAINAVNELARAIERTEASTGGGR